MRRNDFAGTGALFRLFLRRDRWIFPTWVLLTVSVLLGQAGFVAAMPDWKALLTELSESPVARGILGPIDPLSIEGAVLWRGMIQSAMVLIIACGLTAIRHTRTEEESGRRELLLGRSIGHAAHLTAAMLLCAMGSAGAGLLSFLALIGTGFGAGGALVAALTLLVTGCLMGAVGGLLGQMCQTAGSAKRAFVIFLGVNYLGMFMYHMDVGRFWVWLSPFIWYRLTRPYGGNTVLPLLGLCLIGAVITAVAYRLALRRDLGRGAFLQREPRQESLRSIGSVWALVWHRQRGGVLIWVMGLAALGFALGLGTPNIAEGLSGMLVGMTSWGQALDKMGARETFVAVSLYMVGLMGGGSVYGIANVLQLRGEERTGHAELLLSRPVSRAGWMGSSILFGCVGGILMLAGLGLATGLGWAIGMGDSSLILRAVAMCLTKLPSLWFIMGIAALLYGWLPKVAGVVSWVLLGGFIVIEMLWEAGLVGWNAMRLSPLSYAHYTTPLEVLPLLPLAMMTLLAAGLIGLGIAGFKRRNLQ